MQLLKLKKEVKDIQRLEEIIQVFFEAGLGYHLHRLKLKIHLPFHKRIRPHLKLTSKQETAIRLRNSFEKLGPTFVKLGQLLSIRPDLIPIEFTKEFEKLQDQVPSFPYSQAKKIIEAELGKPLEKIFKTFQKTPVASASIAQVHKATLKNGKIVAVKVQRPNIKEIIEEDLDILLYFAHLLEKHFPETKNYRPSDVVNEFATWTRKELDFTLEAESLQRFQENFKNNDKIKAPNVYKNLSNKKVMVMEYIDGVKIDDLPQLKTYQINIKNLAFNLFSSIMQQIIKDGQFHADPHPANIYVLKNGTVVFLDFGITGELSEDSRKKIIKFLIYSSEKNTDKVIETILSMAHEFRNPNLDHFKQETRYILESLFRNSIKDRSAAGALYEIIATGAKDGIIFDPNYVLMAKALLIAEGTCLKLYPSFNVETGIGHFVKQWKEEEYSPGKIIQKFTKSFLSHSDYFINLPEHAFNILDNLEHPPQKGINEQQISELKKIKEEVEHLNKKKPLSYLIFIILLALLAFFYLEGKTHLLGIKISTIFIISIILLLTYLIIYQKD
jgi:ubiquinone biosynthesis protein